MGLTFQTICSCDDCGLTAIRGPEQEPHKSVGPASEGKDSFFRCEVIENESIVARILCPACFQKLIVEKLVLLQKATILYL